MNKELFLKDIGFVPHAGGQKEAFMSDARFKILCNGRRWGKSLYAAVEAINYLFRENKRIWVVGPTYDLSRKVFREIYRYVRPRRKIWYPDGHCSDSKSEMRILTNWGTEILGKSADNPDSLIGEGLDLLIIDEAARIKEVIWDENLRPTLTDRQGKAIIISTPKGRNWFYHLWTRGKDPQFPLYRSWRHPTSDNPHIAPEEIEEARMTLPDRAFRQEYLAEFLEDTGGVFRNVRRLIRKTLRESLKGESFHIGVDLAKYMDFTVITVLDRKGDLVYFDRFNKIDWNLQKERIRFISKKYPGKIVLDSTGVGDPIYDELRKDGLNVEGYRFTSPSKEQLINNLSMVIEQELVHLDDIPELINELEIFEYQITPSRNLKMSAPEGYHDDCVISLALAAWSYHAGNSLPAFYSRSDKY